MAPRGLFSLENTMNPSVDNMIEETTILINNYYNLSLEHYENVKSIVHGIFYNIVLNEKICRFTGKIGSGTSYYYNISMPYVLYVLAKYTDYHVVMVFESVYILDSFKKEVKSLFKASGIDDNHRFKLTMTTIHRVRYSCIGNAVDVIIGWLPSGNLFSNDIKDIIVSDYRSLSKLVLLSYNYLTIYEFEGKMNLLLSNGFKIRA